MESDPSSSPLFPLPLVYDEPRQYAVETQIRFHGHDPSASLLQLYPREGETSLRTEDILDTIEKEGDSIALVLLSGVQYYTGT